MSTTDDTHAARRGSGSNDQLGLVERLRHEAWHTGYKPTKPWDLLVDAADEIERLRARVLELEAVHEDASGAILQAVAAVRERCAKLCESVASDLENAEEDAQALSTGAQSCADQIRTRA